MDWKWPTPPDSHGERRSPVPVRIPHGVMFSSPTAALAVDASGDIRNISRRYDHLCGNSTYRG